MSARPAGESKALAPTCQVGIDAAGPRHGEPCGRPANHRATSRDFKFGVDTCGTHARRYRRLGWTVTPFKMADSGSNVAGSSGDVQ